MKKFNAYISTMYKPAFLLLVICLTVLSILLLFIAVSLRQDILAGESDVIYRYPQMLEMILLPATATFPIIIVIDIKERKRKN